MIKVKWEEEGLEELRVWLEQIINAMEVMEPYIAEESTLLMMAVLWDKALSAVEEVE